MTFCIIIIVLMKRRRRVLWMQSWNIVPVVGTGKKARWLLHIKTLENKCKQCDIQVTRGNYVTEGQNRVLHHDTLVPAGAFLLLLLRTEAAAPHPWHQHTARTDGAFTHVFAGQNPTRQEKNQWLHLTASRKSLVLTESKETLPG